MILFTVWPGIIQVSRSRVNAFHYYYYYVHISLTDLSKASLPNPLSCPAGHIYYFLEDVYPRMTGRRPLKTPGFLKALFPQEQDNTQPHVVAAAPPPAQMMMPDEPGQQQQGDGGGQEVH